MSGLAFAPEANAIRAARVDVNWEVARRFAWLYGRVKDATGLNLRGLGWLQRRVKREHVFLLAGQQIVFDPAVAGCYDRMIAGEFNEQATYEFLLRAIALAPRAVTFVEVGANVGELLIPIAAHPQITRAIGYEPQLTCAAVCSRNAQMNSLLHVDVRAALVGDGTTQRFHVDNKNPNASAIGNGEPTTTLRLDDDLPDLEAPLIMLIDVEGAEPMVLAGARRTIAELQPLIVFEYNELSRKHFRIGDIAKLLGPHYTIHRLRADGSLDDQVEESWNCVAIPRDSVFQKLCA